jgi:hypothetical protein
MLGIEFSSCLAALELESRAGIRLHLANSTEIRVAVFLSISGTFRPSALQTQQEGVSMDQFAILAVLQARPGKENDVERREGKGMAKSGDPNRINNVSID